MSNCEIDYSNCESGAGKQNRWLALTSGRLQDDRLQLRLGVILDQRVCLSSGLSSMTLPCSLFVCLFRNDTNLPLFPHCAKLASGAEREGQD